MVLSRALGLSQSLVFPTECAENEGVRAQRRGASRTSRAMWDLSSVAPPPPCPPTRCLGLQQRCQPLG